MKTLIVYFSLDGNTEYMAERIGEHLDAGVLRIDPVKKYRGKGFIKILLGGKDAVTGAKPALTPYDPQLENYDRVVIGFPVWASTFAPPVKTFIAENRDGLREKSLSAFCCEAGNGGEKALHELSEFIGKDLVSKAVFIEPKKRPSEETEEKLSEFLKELDGE